MNEQFSCFIDRLYELSEESPEFEQFRAEWRQFLLRERYNYRVFSTVMNTLDEVVFTIDPETRSISSCNKAVQRILGYKPQEVIGRNTAFIHLDTQHYDRFGRDSEAKLNRGKRYTAEFPLRRKNGQIFEAEITVIPLLDDNNWLGGVVSKIRDISLLKAQESLRRRNTSRLRLITEQVPTILWTTDRDFTITSLMGKEVYKLRLDKRPLLHHRIDEIFTSREDREVLQSHKSALEGGRSSFEVMYEGYIFKAYVEPMYDEDETISGVIGVAYDISEQKQLERKYAERVKELQAIFDNASDSIIVLDNEGRYVQMNRANEELIGYTEDELLGKSAMEVLDEKSRQRFQGIWTDFMRQGEAVGEVNVERKNGEIRTIEYLAAAQILPNKNLVLARDITERKKYEDNLERNLREREILIKEIHHRVKNNLQIIISMLNLQNEGLPDSDSRCILEDATARVYSIALAYEKLHFTKNLELVQIEDYYRDIIIWYIEESSKAISFETEIEPLFFNINAAVLSGIMLNELIMICLSHDFSGVSGGIIKLKLQKKSAGEIHLNVWDNGVERKNQPLKKSQHLLGLRLVDTLAEQLGGRVEHEQNNGSSVSVYLPISSVMEE